MAIIGFCWQLWVFVGNYEFSLQFVIMGFHLQLWVINGDHVFLMDTVFLMAFMGFRWQLSVLIDS